MADDVLLTLIARLPVEGIAVFQQYEAAVLPLLGAHSGVLERRLRNNDGTVEVHIVRFATREAFERFRSDPRRAAAAPLLQQSGASIELLEVRDVE